MTENILYFIHYALTLMFGIILSFSFCGLRLTKRNWLVMGLSFACGGLLQLVVLALFGEENTWKWYPALVHIPLGMVLCIGYRKRVITALSAVTLSYLCCQPSKWIGVFLDSMINHAVIIWLIRIAVVSVLAVVLLRWFAPCIAEIFNKDSRSVLIFGSIPLVYYLFDYMVGVYTDLWYSHNQVVSEFLAFFLCLVFMAFCVLYYKEYEKKADAERKEQMIRMTIQQQAKEIDAIKKSNLETRLLRHDMQLLLGNLAVSIENDDKKNSLKLISGYTKQVEAASLRRYCKNDTVHYVLANFENKCREAEVRFQVTVELEEVRVDEILLSSVISNALENALNAQAALPAEERQIVFMLKEMEGKLLLSVKNPFKEKPIFADGLPVSSREGHGYGTQSIRYMTARMGGRCQFSVQDQLFILRVVL